MKILDYELQSLIGRGGFSEVYRAVKNGDVRDEQTYAIKILNPPIGTSSQDALAAMRYEFWVLKDLRHQNIVRVHDFGALPDGRLYIVEDDVSGMDLNAFCHNRPFAECEPVLTDILTGLKALHDWHIIHGDLKPGNIHVIDSATGPLPVILDFGLARSFSRAATPQAAAGISGTPAMLAPEIIVGEAPSPRSDLYALGVSFIEALTGTNPFATASLDETVNRHLTVTPEPVGLQRSDVPPVWNELLQGLLRKNPAERPQTAAQALFRIGRKDVGFTLNPTPFVGRQRELECQHDILKALEKNTPLAITVQSAAGLGASRLLREILFRVLSAKPEWRGRIGLVTQEPFDLKTVLLLDGIPPPSSHRLSVLRPTPFTLAETAELLRLKLGLRDIPEEVIRRVYELSAGKPRLIDEILTLLAERGLLSDAAGQVSRAMLDLIVWDENLSTTEIQSDLGFDALATALKRKLLQRKLTAADPLWKEAEASLELNADAGDKPVRRARLLSLKGGCFIDEGRLAQASEVLQTALALLADRPEERIMRIRTRNYLAYVALRQRRSDEAIALYEMSAQEIQTQLTPEQAAEISNLDLGLAYLEAGRFEEAIASFQTRLACLSGPAAAAARLPCLYNLSLAFAATARLPEAKRHFEELLTAAREARDPTYLLRAYNGLGNVESRAGQSDAAIAAYDQALELSLALKDLRSAAAAAQNRGGVKAAQQRFNEAKSDLELSFRYAESASPRYTFEKNLMCRALTELGSLELNRGATEEAREALDRAWHLADKDEDLAALRFWVLASRLKLWTATGNQARFRSELARIRHEARSEEQKQVLAELEGDEARSKVTVAEKERERAEEELTVVLRINRDLAGDVPLEELLRRILSHAIDLSQAELGVLLLSDNKGGLVPRLSLNADLTTELGEISLTVARRALEIGAAVRTHDALADAEYNRNASVLNLDLKSILGLPVSFRGRLLGVLYLSHRRRRGLFDDKCVRILSAFADQAGIALANNELLEHYKRTSETTRAELENAEIELSRAREKLKITETFDAQLAGGRTLITCSPKLRTLLSQAERLAASEVTIIIHGPSGSGKELLARFLHEKSRRKAAPFVAVNCGALPENLIESELFGHRRGAFSGADRDRAGLIETAQGGTLFLDEIADLPLAAQVKLLRVLQEREIVRLGETTPRPVDVRVLAASHRNLRDAFAKGLFREDLYYRLCGMEISLPGLAERQEDVPLLSEHFLQEALVRAGRKHPKRIAPSLLKKLVAYNWPGNIRELKNLIEVGVSLSEAQALSETDLPTYLSERLQGPVTTTPAADRASGWYDPRKSWREHELLAYASALSHHDFDPVKTAASLGVGIATVYKWLREHRLRETRENWQELILPYPSGLKLEDIKRHVFCQALARHPGHPYRAAKELDVSPATVYRYAQTA